MLSADSLITTWHEARVLTCGEHLLFAVHLDSSLQVYLSCTARSPDKTLTQGQTYPIASLETQASSITPCSTLDLVGALANQISQNVLAFKSESLFVPLSFHTVLSAHPVNVQQHCCRLTGCTVPLHLGPSFLHCLSVLRAYCVPVFVCVAMFFILPCVLLASLETVLVVLGD